MIVQLIAKTGPQVSTTASQKDIMHMMQRLNIQAHQNPCVMFAAATDVSAIASEAICLGHKDVQPPHAGGGVLTDPCAAASQPTH